MTLVFDKAHNLNLGNVSETMLRSSDLSLNTDKSNLVKFFSLPSLMHAYFALQCIFEEITLVVESKVSSLKTKPNMENICINRLLQVGLYTRITRVCLFCP